MKVKIVLMVMLMTTLCLFSACKKDSDEDQEKIGDLEYTVLELSNFPEIMATKIEAEKTKPFKFSYTDGEFMYIAIGYGEQATGGYSVQMAGLYETKNYIVIKAKLLGPTEKDIAATSPSYPFIVIKTEDLKLPVCFK